MYRNVYKCKCFTVRPQNNNVKTSRRKKSGSVFTNHSQEHSLSLSPTFANWNVTRILIG